MSSSRMDAKNGWTLSAQLLSAGWATIAEIGNRQKTTTCYRENWVQSHTSQATAGQCPTEPFNSQGKLKWARQTSTESCGSTHQNGKPLNAFRIETHNPSPPQAFLCPGMKRIFLHGAYKHSVPNTKKKMLVTHLFTINHHYMCIVCLLKNTI